MTTRTDNTHYIEQLASTWEPKLRDAFLAAIRDIANNVDIAALTRLIEQGNIQGALAAVGADVAHFNTLVVAQQSAYNAGGLAAVRAAPPLPQLGGYSVRMLWNIRAPSAELWLRNESSTLVTEIVDDQRDVIRTRLEAGMRVGVNPRQTALDLVGRIQPGGKVRTGGVIGLSSNQEQWLTNYETELASTDPTILRQALLRGLRDKRFDATVLKAIKNGTGIPADLRDKMSLAYRNRALRWRGENIARNETIKALGAAQTEAYQQNIDSGKLDAGLIVRFWATVGDDRVRPTHRLIPGMNKAGRKWNEPFETPDGPTLHAPFEIGCRCHEKISIGFLEDAVRKFKASQR